MTKLVPNKEHSRTALSFVSHLKKTAAESCYLEKLMVNMLHRKKRMNDGFSVSKLEVADKEHGKPPKKYEDV